MRIIDHTTFKPLRKRAKKHRALLFVLVLTVCIAALVVWHQDSKAPSGELKKATPTPTAPDISATPKPTKLTVFTGMEFRKLYEGYAYPNTIEITTYPDITGNASADDRIRLLAKARGYIQRSVPLSPMVKIEDGYQLQQRAVHPWHDMQAAAKKDGLTLGLTAAFRSPEDQRTLFMERFNAAGANAAAIAAGYQDALVTSLLRITAIPGFSRHHTGYTVDISCESDPDVTFANSACFRWLKANNYQHAKEHGWIPSYPDGAGDQGPDPEPWEYVWIGTASLYE